MLILYRNWFKNYDNYISIVKKAKILSILKKL